MAGKTIVEAFNELADVVKATKLRTKLGEDTIVTLLRMQIDMHVSGFGATTPPQDAQEYLESLKEGANASGESINSDGSDTRAN